MIQSQHHLYFTLLTISTVLMQLMRTALCTSHEQFSQPRSYELQTDLPTYGPENMEYYEGQNVDEQVNNDRYGNSQLMDPERRLDDQQISKNINQKTLLGMHNNAPITLINFQSHPNFQGRPIQTQTLVGPVPSAKFQQYPKSFSQSQNTYPRNPSGGANQQALSPNSGSYNVVTQSQGYNDNWHGTKYPPGHIEILKHHQEITPGSLHHFEYATQNGIKHKETTLVRYQPGFNPELLKDGHYSYTAPNGQLVSVSYQADAFGFQQQNGGL